MIDDTKKPRNFQGHMDSGANEKKIELNALRRKILFELSINPRFSYATIAKNIGVSPEVVAYNVDKLKEQKILTGSIAIINPKAINCQSYELYLRLQNYSPDQLKDFINYFVEQPKIRWVANGSGHFDLMLSVISQDFEDFNNILNEIKIKLGKQLVKYIMLPLLEEDFLYSIFFLDKLDVNKFYNRLISFKGKDDGSFQKYFVESQKKEFKDVKLDNLDKNIISILECNTTENILTISSKLNVSINTVKNRIINLIDNRIIKRFFPTISYNILGYQWHLTMLNLNLDSSTEKQFLYFITIHPYIVYYSKTIGQYNYIISIIVKDAVHYNNIMLELRNQFYKYINDYDDILVFTQYKYVYFKNQII